MKFFLGIFVSVFLAVAVWLYKDQPVAIPVLESQQQLSPVSDTAIPIEPVFHLSASSASANENVLLPENISGYKRWELLQNWSYEVAYEDIHFINREGKVYPSYSIETLQGLAAQGDVKAMKELAYRLEQDLHRRTNEPNFTGYFEMREHVKSAMTDIVVHGDRAMLDYASIYLVDPAYVSDPLVQREAFLQRLAFYEFIGMRGRYPEKYIGVLDLIRQYETEHGKLDLSVEEKQAIHVKAAEMYAGFETKRMEIGLGPFDNSVSDFLMKHAEQARQEFNAELGGNAF